VELLRREKPEFIAADMWPPNSPDMGVMQERVYHTPVQDMADLRQKAMSTSAALQLSVVDEQIKQIDQWQKRLDPCV